MPEKPTPPPSSPPKKPMRVRPEMVRKLLERARILAEQKAADKQKSR